MLFSQELEVSGQINGSVSKHPNDRRGSKRQRAEESSRADAKDVRKTSAKKHTTSKYPQSAGVQHQDFVSKLVKPEPRVKEEGEISDAEASGYDRHGRLDKETKEAQWHEWCAEMMSDHVRTLKRLHKLQTTSVDLPKEEVFGFLRLNVAHAYLCYRTHMVQQFDELCRLSIK